MNTPDPVLDDIGAAPPNDAASKADIISGLSEPETDAPPDTSPPPPARPGVALTAWPVPMRTTLTLGWTMPLPGRVTLAVFDTRGRLVRRLVAAGVMASGSHTATWDGLDTDGRRVPAGLYWARLEVGDDRRTVRLPLAP